MKKAVKILGIILLCIIVLIAAGIGFLIYSSQSLEKKQAEDQANMAKSDAERLGERFLVPRDGKDPVEVNLYIPDGADDLPVVFNIHGGAFIAGDADTLDTQRDRISRDWNVAVLALKAEDMDVAAQVLCYAYIGDAVAQYSALTAAQQATIAPALFVPADNDSFSDESLAYQAALEETGVPTVVKQYDGAIHGFLEENNPEYEQLHIKISKSPEQEKMARDAEDFIGDWLSGQFAR